MIKLENWTTGQILLLVLLIILIVPNLLTLPAIWSRLDFSETGQLGDTIGGLTAPFINGLSVVLVYLAFKEQIKANKSFERLERQKMATEEYYDLRARIPDIKTLLLNLSNSLEENPTSFDIEDYRDLDRIHFFLSDWIIHLNKVENNEIAMLQHNVNLYRTYFQSAATHFYRWKTNYSEEVKPKYQIIRIVENKMNDIVSKLEPYVEDSYTSI